MNLRKHVKFAIEKHALAEYPRECCGLIVADGRKQKYIPCMNHAENNADFKLSAEDYAAAEDTGQIIAVVHSHIDISAQPSELDLVSCEASALPWIIVAIHKDPTAEPEAVEWVAIEPKGYEAPLVGRSFHHGSLDCYGLIRDFYRIELGIELPDFERPDDWWSKPETGELYLDNFERAGFSRATGDIKYGDVILMQYRSERTNHAGVYLGNTPLKTQPDLHPVMNAMIHHPMPSLSERAVYAGYWADVTRMIIRHKDM